jgi:transcriptional regulator with XRE-family HTH domain
MAGEPIVLGKIIRDARLKLRLSQQQLAERVGVTKGAISQWETGIGFPSRTNARALAKELGIDQRELEARLSSGLNLLDALPSGREIPIMGWDDLKVLGGSTVRNRTKSKRNTPNPARSEAMLPVDVDIPMDSIAAAVADDSMSPDYQRGDCVIFSPSVAPRLTQPYDIVVALIDDDRVMLRSYVPRGVNRAGVQVFDLVSTNTDHEHFETISGPSSRSIKLLGTVVEHRKKRRP